MTIKRTSGIDAGSSLTSSGRLIRIHCLRVLAAILIMVCTAPNFVATRAQEIDRDLENSQEGPLELVNSASAPCQQRGTSLRFLLAQKPESLELSFPRLNNVVHFAYWSAAATEIEPQNQTSTEVPSNLPAIGPNEYSPPKLPPAENILNFSQTPSAWSIELNESISYPAIVTLQLATPPVYAPEGFTCQPGEDGVITLSAKDAIVSGDKLQFEPLTHKNTVGYWVNPKDFAQWKFQTEIASSPTQDSSLWDVHVLQGCGTGQGGSLVRFDFENIHLEHTVVETGHFQNFRWLHLGTVSLDPASSHTLKVSCQKLARGAVMDIRQIRLVPQSKNELLSRGPRPASLISETQPDLQPPPVTLQSPGPGRRTIMRLPDESQSGQAPESPVYYTLYLPTNWNPKQRYPVIVEWAGNGPFKNDLGDSNTGRVEDGVLGYGLAGNDGFIWVCLPYLNEAGTHPVTQWWGNAPIYAPQATLDFASRAVTQVCDQFSGDAEKVVLAGFSRGSIACNFLGLHDDAIAKNWRAFICFSHYDGLLRWPYPGSDPESAKARLQRLAGRPQLILAESLREPSRPENSMLVNIENYLNATQIQGDFTFLDTGFRNHDDDWLLRPSEARKQTRDWLYRVLDLPARDESL